MTENPYKYLRQLTKTSQKDFAAKYDFSKTTMVYIESGQYADLSENMILSLGQECFEKGVDAGTELELVYNSQTLAEAYKSWQSLERLQVAHLFQSPPSGQFTAEKSPFAYFIEETTGSLQKFCKTLKVPSATVARYSDGVTRSMPQAVETALKEVQFRYLEDLRELQEAWASAR